MKQITGGVSAPIGFTASGVHCGVKSSENKKNDLAVIFSDCDCVAAGVYTKNQVKAAPIHLTQKHLEDGHLRGILVNSGNANACAPQGMENATKMAQKVAEATQLSPEDFAVASTGVIGVTLNIDAIEAGIPNAVQALSKDGSADASQAILTTDTITKEIAISLELDGKTVTIGAIAKGSGMIHPNMGTMLCFVTTDCAIDKPVLQNMLSSIVAKTFNRITVDGDCSTNDCCLLLSNGKANNSPLVEGSKDYDHFYEALYNVFEYEAKQIARDGEGAGRLISCTVLNAETEEKAESMAKSVVSSSLVKTAMFGSDANWGRVLCAVGYSGATFNPEEIDVSFISPSGTIRVCQDGIGLDFDETLAKTVLSDTEIEIIVSMKEGTEKATCWGCDLTYDYVKINGDYRS